MIGRSAPEISCRAGVVLAVAGTAQLALLVALSGGPLAAGLGSSLLARADLVPAVVIATASFVLTRPWLRDDVPDRRAWWLRAAMPLWLAWWMVVAFAMSALHLHPGKAHTLSTVLIFRPVGEPSPGLSVGPIMLTVALTALLAPLLAASTRAEGSPRPRSLGRALAVPAALIGIGLTVRGIAVATGHRSLWGVLSWPPAHLHLVGVGIGVAVLVQHHRRHPELLSARRLRLTAVAVAGCTYLLSSTALGLPRSPLMQTAAQWYGHTAVAMVFSIAVLLAVFVRTDTPLVPAVRAAPRTVATLATIAPGVLLAGETSYLLIAQQYRERVAVTSEGTFLRGGLTAPFIWSLITAAMFGVLIVAVVASVLHVLRHRRLPRATSPLALPAVVATAWFVRVGTLLSVAPERTDGGDPLFYHTTANVLARGRGFPEPLNWIAFGVHRPSAFHGPLYPVVLSVSSRFGGTSYFDHKMMSIVIGTALVAVVAGLAHQLAGRRAALLAALLAAVYPNLWLVDSLLYPENLMALLTTCTLWIAYRWRERPRFATAALLGGMVALAALARGEAMLLLPLMVVPWMWWHRPLERPQRLRNIVVATLTCLAVLAPWMVRNAATFTDFVPLSTNGNEVLVYSNCDSAYHGKFVGYWDFNCQEQIRQDGNGPDASVLDESQVANFWKDVGVEYAKEHVGDLPRVAALRVLRQWELFRPLQNVELVVIEGRDRDASLAGLGMYYALMVSAGIGLVSLRRRGTGVWPFVVLFLSVTITAAYTYGNIRFRAPVEPAICVLGAIGAMPVARRLRRWFQRRSSDVPDCDPAAFVAGGRGGLRIRSAGVWRGAALRTWAAIAAVLAVCAIPLRGLYQTTGGTMEEAFMLVFPERMWKGDLPNVDFLHLYGPGALHVLMGWYKVVGYSLEAERTFGLLQHLGIIFGLFTLARPWGRVTAFAVAGLSVFYVFTPIGLTAMAWNGGLALCLWSVVFALRARHVEAPRRSLVTAGILAGLALTYRPDLGLALLLVYGWYLWRNRRWRPLATGVVVGLLPMWVHLAMVGPGAAFEGMVVDPVFRLRAGRALPRPPSWNRLDGSLQAIAELVPPWWKVPSLSAEKSLFIWFFAVLIAPLVLLWAGRLAQRRRPDSPQAITLIAVGLFSVGIVPQALQRPDSTHLAWVSCISFPFLVVAIVEWLRAHRPQMLAPQRAVIAGAALVVATLVVAPLFTFRYYLLHSRVSIGNVQTPFPVERDGRRFYLGDYGPYLASRDVIADLDRLSEPGDRLLVGPEDLRRTWYSDSFFYYLFPELTPATYFIEMDPGLANDPTSPLADEVASADWIILTAFWNGWQEPNSSMEFGSDAPNQVIRDQFCLVRSYEDGLVLLYRKCSP